MGDETTTQLGCVRVSKRVAPASILRKEGEGAKEGGRGRGKPRGGLEKSRRRTHDNRCSK
jgi:hypothetical protein